MGTLLKKLQESAPSVLLIGDVICDQYMFGSINRISPEAPVPVFEMGHDVHALGGAANVAANLRALNCDVRLVGVTGVDSAAAHVRNLLQDQGIADSWLIEDPTRPTTQKLRLIAHQQHVIRLDQESQADLAHSLQSQIVSHASRLVEEVDGVIISDYHKAVCTPQVLEPIFLKARALNRPIFVDPKKQSFSCFRGVTVLTPNFAELEQASRLVISSETAMEQAAELLLNETEAQALLVTRGKDGMSLFSRDHDPVHISSQAREVFDVTGAGDTVIAAFGTAVLCGVSMPEAARLANFAAGIVVGKSGTATVSLNELAVALDSTNISSSNRQSRHQSPTTAGR